MQLHFRADDDFIASLKQRTHAQGAAEVARDALDFWDWATAQTAAGRQIVSTDPSGGPHYVPVMPSLNRSRD